MTPRKHAAVIKAWADGAEIECRLPLSTYPPLATWTYCGEPSWYLDYEYRVKPEKKTPGDILWEVLGGTRAMSWKALDAATRQMYETRAINFLNAMKEQENG